MYIKPKIVSSEEAAIILSRHLGDNPEAWGKFLREHLHDQSVLFHIWGRNGASYRDSDLYRFIARRNRTALGFSKRSQDGSVQGSTFKPDAHIQVDYEHAGKLVLEIVLPEFCYGKPWISPTAARQFAAKLNQLADDCDNSKFNFDYWHVLRKGEKYPSYNELSTGDDELDCLLAELG